MPKWSSSLNDSIIFLSSRIHLILLVARNFCLRFHREQEGEENDDDVDDGVKKGKMKNVHVSSELSVLRRKRILRYC